MFAILPGGIGSWEVMIIGIIAVILFGSRLPEVARNAGKHYHKFKKSLMDIQSSFDPDNYDDEDVRKTSIRDDYDDFEEDTTPKFSAPPSDEE